jgi:hypothetical protein
MGSVIVSLLPIIIASAVMPAPIILTVMLLKSPQQGLLKASAFVVGMTSLRLLQGLIFGLILTDSTAAAVDEGSGKSALVSTLLMLLGILFLIAAYKKWIKEDDPDAPPPKWIAMIDSITPLHAFGIGFGLLLIGAKFWVFTLSAISVIGDAHLGQPASSVAYLIFVLLAVSLLLLLILIRLVLPERSKVLLDSTSIWLARYNRPILIGVSLLFGLVFLVQGVSGLLQL